MTVMYTPYKYKCLGKKTLMDEWEIFYRGNILQAEVFLLLGF